MLGDDYNEAMKMATAVTKALKKKKKKTTTARTVVITEAITAMETVATE